LRCLGFLPLGQRSQLVHDFLQPLQTPFLIGGPDHLLATLKVEAIGGIDLRDFFAELRDSFFDRNLHLNRLAEVFTAM
jgi:hypothetical protein